MSLDANPMICPYRRIGCPDAIARVAILCPAGTVPAAAICSALIPVPRAIVVLATTTLSVACRRMVGEAFMAALG